ncbi:hypothetical protein ACNOYE_29270 [Nannocystaceae bacterium ST9]
MVELDDAMRRALLAREGPPPGARAEILAGLRARLGGPGDPGSGEASSDPGSLGVADAGARTAWAAKVAAATIGLTASGLLALKLGSLAVGGLAGESAREPTVAATSEAIERAPALGSASEPAEAPPKRAAPEQIEAPAPRVTEAPRASEAEVEDESSLAAELALVRAAERLRVDDREAALAELEEHRRRFAVGVLASEREALRIELLCELGRTKHAEVARERFLVEFGGSPLRARVLASCSNDGTDSNPAGD